jgi:NitT/TauT family transport system substrate-binding protein
MVHRSSGIERLADLRDVTLAMQVAAAHFQYLQRRVPLTGVTVVPYSGSIAEFLANPRWAQQAYAISEPILAAAKGSDPRCLLIADIGFNPYTSVLVTREALIRTAPDVVRAMVVASAKGWKRYLEDPAPVHAHILEVNPEIGRTTLERGVQELAPFVLTEDALGAGIGTMSAERWRTLAAQMLDARSLTQPVDAASAFDAGFLPRP